MDERVVAIQQRKLMIAGAVLDNSQIFEEDNKERLCRELFEL
jgi:hypothetical protein